MATDWSLSFIEGNILKYLARYKAAQISSKEAVKGGVEDLHKARHYLNKLIEISECDG